MTDNSEQQLRKLKDSALTHKEVDDNLDRKIYELEQKIKKKYHSAQKDKWHRMKDQL